VDATGRQGSERREATVADTVDGRPKFDGRTAVVVALDAVCWIVGALIVGRTSGPLEGLSFVVLAAALTTHLVLGLSVGLYRNRFRAVSDDEAVVAALVGAASTVVALVAGGVMARSDAPPGGLDPAVLLVGYLAVAGMITHRLARRVRARRVARRRLGDGTPVIVIGAGEGGFRAINVTLQTPESPYRPVALLDDDPARRRTYIGGLSVSGTTDDLARVAVTHRATAALVAIPSASAAVLRRLNDTITQAGLVPLVLPPVEQLTGPGQASEIRHLSDEELLGRELIEIDDVAVRSLLADTVVLVTGAGGSIGSELARQIAQIAPSALVLVDNDDSHLHEVRRTLHTAAGTEVHYVLADIRDRDRMYEVFARFRPTTVFHAAALKHVPALEENPGEGWKTNVLGTANVLEAAASYAADRVVNISTDKAAEPVNVLGLTKRIAERVTAAFAEEVGQPYVSVRFGNVLASRGSAIETFRRQIAAGGPVTVTDPDATRYFMAIREAVRLTLQAAAIGRAGEVLVLDMGEPVAVIDVARQMIEQSGQDIEIVVTGLRPGEKLHEVLLGHGEVPDRPFHPMIDHVPVVPLHLAEALSEGRVATAGPTTRFDLARIASYGLHTTITAEGLVS
jgi:FlaA1/EpsC-like NDP-sugar epimerase